MGLEVGTKGYPKAVPVELMCCTRGKRMLVSGDILTMDSLEFPELSTVPGGLATQRNASELERRNGVPRRVPNNDLKGRASD